jgi:hypothetical protein
VLVYPLIVNLPRCKKYFTAGLSISNEAKISAMFEMLLSTAWAVLAERSDL